ncbi:hypothetical protein QFZ23_000346 [Arthrobacter globiformis]|nr:hypothetical protein [Arthrobacter globiformis]
MTWGVSPGPVLTTVIAVVLVGAVLAAVHHAEVVAQRVGEPLGSLVLAVAVTVIEVALIVTLIASGGEGSHSLARDTVFAAVMITVNGIVGIALLVGAPRYGFPRFNPEGSGAALAVVLTLATLTLVLPTFTSSRPGLRFGHCQHRPDDSRHCGGQHLAAGTVDAGARRHADSPVPAERHSGNTHGGARPCHPPAGGHPPGSVRRVPLPRHVPVTGIA